MSIVFVGSVITPGSDPTVDTWRSLWPAEELKRRGYDAYLLGPGGVMATTGYARDDTIVIHVSNQDVGLSGTVRWLRRKARARGVYVSFDDDYRSLGVIQDTDRPWFDQLMRDHRVGIAEASGFIASTPQVIDAYRDWIGLRPSWVLRNAPPRFLTEIRVERWRPPMAGWFGTVAAHRRDVEWLGAAARSIDRLGVIGAHREFAEITGRRLDHALDAQPWRLLYWHLRRFSVGIVPVVDDAFNRPKSWIKPLEFASLGIPSVVAPLPAYDEARAAGLPLQFVNTPEGMAEAANVRLDMMATAAGARYSDLLREIVRERFVLEGPGGDPWEKWAAEVGAS